MKAALLFAGLSSATGAKLGTNPLAKVLGLMDELTAKVKKEGEIEAKAYAEYVEWCDETAQNTGFAIKTATKKKGSLEAQIEELTSDASVATSKIEELAASIASSDGELKDATAVRKKEEADFVANEKELTEALSALDRALAILEKEMAKNPASFAQIDTTNMANAVQAIGVVLEATTLSSGDQQKLMALVQAQENSDSDDMGAPAAAAYKTQSGGILNVLEEMREKAEGQLSELRKAEVKSKHNYDMLSGSLEAQTAADKKDLADQKSAKKSADEEKAAAEGDLEVTIKDLANSKKALGTAQGSCIQTAADTEASQASRKEELAAIAKAKQILTESSSGAESQTYSFLQTSSARQRNAQLEVIAIVKHLAKQQRSTALAQLASTIAAVSKSSDPFAKIKGLVEQMIAKLEKEAEADATEKAYCDEQMSKTEAKKSELEDDIEKMTSTIDRSLAKAAQLKADIKELEAELAELTKSQAEMDKIRGETHAEYEQAKSELELGLDGVRKALAVLREYYGGASASMLQQPKMPASHSKASGAGGSIMDILEVVESDFATNLAKVEAEEADAQAEYEEVTQENEVTKTLKNQDVKYKTKESKSHAATVAEFSSDRKTADNELSAVLEYYEKIKDRCIAKPETYEDRKARRAAEIEGLKKALSILEDEAAFVQRKRRGTRFLAHLSA